MANLCKLCHKSLCLSQAAGSQPRLSSRPFASLAAFRVIRQQCRPRQEACLQRLYSTRGSKQDRDSDDLPEGSAIEVEADEEEQDLDEDYLEPEDEETQRANKLAELQAADAADAPLPADYKLNFLWFDKTLAIAVDQVMPKGQRSPVTSYFLWPHADAWEELKDALEGKPWVSERDTIMLLNRVTEVINYWQEEGDRHELDEARTSFPDCVFQGA
ncbi:hypothetical protein WJX74_001791 [Apatococcus lobatus]|uniref:30S ribosomal protein 3, chloroplastic n=2 Tax=Apatococcus TaxID=904362 RepID=A0AAW1SLS9_9CHLO